jgi:MGT family glycosyltransferase
LGFQRIDEDWLDATMFSRSTPASWKRPFQFGALLRGWILGTVPQQVDDLTTIMANWDPDVIVTETSMWGPLLVLHETHDVPVAVFSTVAGCMIPGPEAPPFGLGLPRPNSLTTRLLARLVGTAVNLLSADFRRAANTLRTRYGLPPLSLSVTEFAGQMQLYLMPSVPEFDYQRRDLPSSVHYVGPCLWNRPGDEAPPEWLSALPRDRPWVHVTEGTMHAQDPFLLRSASRGLANLPLQVVMTTGGRRDPTRMDLGLIAPNVVVERWVPHRDLLPHTDVVVTTGGAGTVMTSLSAGIPLVVVPTEWDKPENAQRVVETGTGLRLAPQRCTPKRVRTAVERVLRDPSYRRNALEMAAHLQAYGGPARAAELLEELCVTQSFASSVLPFSTRGRKDARIH